MILAAGIAAPTWLVNSDFFRQWVVAKVNGSIAGRIEVADIGFDTFPGRLSISEVQIFSVGNEPLIQVDRCRIIFIWSALLKRQDPSPCLRGARSASDNRL